MKRMTILLIFLACSLSAMAQQDIKLFHKAGPDAILRMLGDANLAWWDFSPNRVLGTKDERNCDPSICIDGKTFGLTGFFTEKAEYVILSDLVPGGIKVGDRISKYTSVNFARTKYGRGKPMNNCVLAERRNGTDYYTIYGEEFKYFILGVRNGKIVHLTLASCEDLPYPGYDFTNRLFE